MRLTKSLWNMIKMTYDLFFGDGPYIYIDPERKTIHMTSIQEDDIQVNNVISLEEWKKNKAKQ